MRQNIIAAIYFALAGFCFYSVVEWPTIGGRFLAGLTGVGTLYAAYTYRFRRQ